MFKNHETWNFKTSDGDHRVEMEYLILTGELRLRLDGSEIRHWPGGVIAGSRMSAEHSFNIGETRVAFDAGLTKLNRYFRLTVDGQTVKAEPTKLKASDILGTAALIAVLLLVAALSMMFGKK